ncbi:Nif3-like dinuclear metal center hexameric protein [Nostocoides sp. F2B08]|uniref:Nif3-like dinuclear metal center hexameric protein n=1 Tax=Nostocoides sp. F2B08 TaxID=2653936 RepID=UPI0012632DAD|nr:Nif3-like dinuclear metal center hexameric protein [Tetrasphaera sp. F2B08]KAB7744686.1 Nif3-like dinuclear metal center hexameric protein [Tetrasphaera sp. F2B08]
MSEPSDDAPALGEVIAVLERAYPSDSAQSWDRVGLVTGDPDQPVRRIHLALDPTLAVIEEARSAGADLLVTHHPLLLRGVHSVAVTSAKGASVTNLVVGDIALYVAHTNADVAADGVCVALAEACGVHDLEPLVIIEDRPLGRVGHLTEPMTLGEFARVVAAAVPAAPVGIRVAGPPDATIRRVAVLGGSGDDLFDAVRTSGADAYVTADLRHHPALEAREESRGGPPYLIDAGHWASEAVWLPRAAQLLREELGDRVEVEVSGVVTDPWTFVVRPS